MDQPSILIVDDEIIIARELESRLKVMGYDVPAIAASGAEAIELARTLKPDLILMDIVLKGSMDGIEAAAEIRRYHQAPVIYVTAYTDLRTLERAKATEPFGYIVKPFHERELNANIQIALYKHNVETKLRRIERWFAAAVEEIGDAVIMADAAGAITHVNPAAEAITFWPREQAIGRSLTDVLRLARRDTGEPVPLDDVEMGPVVCLAADTLLIDRESREIPIDNTTSCIRDEEERPAGSISVFRDPTGTRYGALVTMNADVALAASRALTLRGMLSLCAESMARTLNATLARIWTVNTVGDTLILQAGAGVDRDLDGHQARIPVGVGEIGLVARERKPYLSNDFLNDERSADADWARRQQLCSFAGYPLLIDDRLVGVMAAYCRRDMSEGITAALGSVAHAIAVGIERKRLEEQLHQAQKMEAIGQLAGGVAHDFNNLLTIISGYSQILLARNDVDSDTRMMVDQIRAAGERAASLTRQLLTFSRKQVVEPKIIDLSALVAGMESMLLRLIGEGISLACVLSPEPVNVIADPGQMEQVIMNIAINASDAMPVGGKLTIETSRVELDAAFAVTHPMIPSGCYVMLAISDTGCGMTPDVQEHVYEPFFTTKEQGKGTGLGLSTVYGIVRQSGGYIGLYSEPGVGTTFKIYLACAGLEASSTEERAAAAPPGGNETILLVEDEHPVRALSRYVLEQSGYRVLDASDGEEALSIAKAHAGHIQMLITDVVLPGMGGRIVAERLRAVRPDIRVLYMSGYTDDAVIRHGILQSETAFIQKPFTPAMLAGKVREVLDG